MIELTNILKNAKVTPQVFETRLKDPIRQVEYPQRYVFILLPADIVNLIITLYLLHYLVFV